MSFFLIAIAVFIALQFADGISTYLMLSTPGSRANGIVEWVASKIGLAPTLITTKVIIIAIAVAVYFFTHLSWIVIAIAAAIYLWKTGRALLLWRSFVNALEVKAEPTDTKPSNIEQAIAGVEARVEAVEHPASAVPAQPATEAGEAQTPYVNKPTP